MSEATAGPDPANGMRLTPTQQRMIDVLRDGQAHNIHEMHACLNDEMCKLDVVHTHIYNIRVRLRPFRRDIISESVGKVIYYRLVGYLTPG